MRMHTLLLLHILLLIILETILSLSYDEIEKDIDNEILSYMKSYCPVSSSFDTEFDSIYGYPMDIFDNLTYQSIITNTNNDLLLEEYFFNCTAIERYSKVHKCSTLTRCPVLKENIITATQRQKQWKISHSLCKIREKLKDPHEIVNLIILGGSVTAGSGSWGCCCIDTIDSKCFTYSNYGNNFEASYYCSTPDHNQLGNVAKICSWPYYFYKWLSRKSMAKINIVDLSEGGATSTYKAEKIIDELKLKSIEQLTENDIVIIDHSVNDANSFNIQNNGKKFAHDKWVRAGEIN